MTTNYKTGDRVKITAGSRRGALATLTFDDDYDWWVLLTEGGFSGAYREDEFESAGLSDSDALDKIQAAWADTSDDAVALRTIRTILEETGRGD